jgi:PAS domain S-box-containing protein
MRPSAPLILVIDDDAVARYTLTDSLRRGGFPVDLAENGDEGVARAVAARPALVILDLVLPPAGGLDVLRRLRAAPETADVPVIVVTASGDGDETEAAFTAGADDFVRKPLRDAELIARIRSQLRLRASVRELARKEQDARVMVELTQALTSSLDFREILATVVRRIAEAMRVERCSIVVAREAGDVGYVLVASDDSRVRDLPIDLERYPEIQRVLQTRRPLTIDDATSHPMFWEVRAHVSSTRFPMLTLVPIGSEESAMGVLFLRASEARGSLDEREVSFCQVVANATAVALRNARVVQKLRDESLAVSSAHVEVERRVNALERYADLFLSSADGMIVIDHSGRVLFTNPKACEILGCAELGLREGGLAPLIAPLDAARFESLREGFQNGEFPAGVDLGIVRADGAQRVVSIATSALLREDGAVLITLRDVTDERATASELSRTKEFLSSLIESSPDAIIAARLDGTILLFNSAAERILAYSREEVVGAGSVEMLYPPGGAKEIMRRIRTAPEGRLASLRAEVLSRAGDRIPVLLSAALVSENGVAVATVGMFSDIRERIQLEERLAQFQHRVALSEKQVIAAELAGAAAHELNQPLTAIQGYAELLQRKAEADSAIGRGAAVILRESERMAEIVRKIGKIARYETKQYVGGTSILDLDRATGSDSIPPEE